ncbi:leucine-rich PPR motif-containing protein, mitochondrial [Pieris brassicae]|uniref:leucine-rich PPR motif-containing protein, mitochondrial n=1 Tax=Pieris brassicae TaxID=7116 RepID=UPI001E661A06|nr:leucine-rich PPR motif-containing protein, mitochondrial [Pieris brassicae]
MSSLLRSTKFVRYFAGAARTLILNSAKTAEANTLLNPKSLCAANSILLRDYATKKTENLEPLLQRLDLEVRRNGRISKRDIDEVFDEIRAKHDITSSQSLLVIRCCGELVPEELPEQRTLLVQKIWNVLNERGIPMDVSHYNALLRVYLENEHAFSPAQFLEEMERKGLQPNRVTYQRLMWRYCQEGDVEGATKVLEKMRELNMPVSEPVLNALVMGHAFHGDTEGAKAVLETMAGAGLTPSNRTYTLLACGYAKEGDIENINKIIAMAEDNDAALSDKDILDIVEYLAVGGHENKVEQLYTHIRKSVGYNQDVCNLILRLLNQGCDATAKSIMKTMSASTNIDDSGIFFKGSFYVKHLIKLNRPADSIIKSCKELQEEALVPKALQIATEVSLQQGQTELAHKLFKELKKDGFEIRQHYYWPLLIQKGKEGDEEGLLQIVRTMTTEDLSPTGEALRDYIIPYLLKTDSPQNVIIKLQLANVPVFHSARNVIVELLRKDNIRDAAEIALRYRPRGGFSIIGPMLINALSNTKDIDSFAKIVHVISSHQPHTEEDTPDDGPERSTVNEVGRVVKQAIKALNKGGLSENLLQAVLDRGLRIDVASAEDIEQILGNNMTTDISKLLSSLTSSDLEYTPLEASKLSNNKTKLNSQQLENLIKKVQDQDGNMARLQKQLLITYMEENNIQKLDSYLKQLKSSNFELTMTTLTQLYEVFLENDMIEKANEIHTQILEKNPDFVINRFKKVMMAEALIRANKFDEAIQYLKDNKPTDDITANFALNAKCWQVLNAVCEEKDVAKIKTLTETLINNNYIEPSNVLLGPLIKVHIMRDDLDSALNEFEYCCKQYRSTPWKGELTKALILKEDANKLQWLADLSTQIHGEINILHDLVLAFVECGRLRQARRILETPGLMARRRKVDEACRRYEEEGKSEYLEGLLEATKDLSILDRSNIFYHLLVTYCKANETDKAVGLWTTLQEEGEIPTDEFLIHLGNHLKSQNKEVPFVIPQHKPVNVQKKNEEAVIKTLAAQKEPIHTKRGISEQIEKLINDGLLSQAMDFTIKSVEDGIVPKENVIKYLLKSLAAEGSVEKIQMLGKYINEDMRKKVTYSDKMTAAIFNRGGGDQHVSDLLLTVEATQSPDELKSILTKFPRSNALAAAVSNEDLSKKCLKIAEISASKGITLPLNLLWLEYLIAGKKDEADAIWNNYLIKSETIVFRRLLQESHLQSKPKLIEELISYLKTNPSVLPSTLGNAYSRLINLHIVQNNLDEAKAVTDEAFKSGLKDTDINKSTLQRLKAAFEEAGKPYQ